MAKKSTLWRYVWQFGKSLWQIIKSIGRGIVSILKAIKTGMKKTAAFTSDKVKESKRPNKEAKYDELKELEMLEGSLERFESKILTSKSLIGIILGARGTGKSALGLKLLENIKAKKSRTVYALGFLPETLPKWITAINSIDQIKNDGAVLVDEGGITFSSRKSMTNANQLLSELLLIARHKDLSIFFITQNSSNLEVNTLRQADFILMKPSSLLQKDFERKKIKDIYQDAHDNFEKHKHKTGATYIYSDWYRGFVSNKLPSFWSDDVSKSWKK